MSEENLFQILFRKKSFKWFKEKRKGIIDQIEFAEDTFFGDKYNEIRDLIKRLPGKNFDEALNHLKKIEKSLICARNFKLNNEIYPLKVKLNELIFNTLSSNQVDRIEEVIKQNKKTIDEFASLNKVLIEIHKILKNFYEYDLIYEKIIYNLQLEIISNECLDEYGAIF